MGGPGRTSGSAWSGGRAGVAGAATSATGAQDAPPRAPDAAAGVRGGGTSGGAWRAARRGGAWSGGRAGIAGAATGAEDAPPRAPDAAAGAAEGGVGGGAAFSSREPEEGQETPRPERGFRVLAPWRWAKLFSRLASSGSIGFLGPLGPGFFGRTSSLPPRTSTRISAFGFLTYSVYNGHDVNEIPRPGCMGVQSTGRLAGNMERTLRILRVTGLFSTPVTDTAP